MLAHAVAFGTGCCREVICMLAHAVAIGTGCCREVIFMLAQALETTLGLSKLKVGYISAYTAQVH